MNAWRGFIVLMLGSAVLGTAPPAAAGDLLVRVENATGAAVEDAVVYAVPAVHAAAAQHLQYSIDQVHRQFIPKVNVVQTGTSVSFPNSDNIRHSVYSFSPARVFTLKLYAGKSAEPVVFDKSGLVVLGCNIHDVMVAFLLVVDTPYFARTDRTGAATLAKLPPGNYTLRTWHSPMGEDQQMSETVHVDAGADALKHTVRLTVPVDPPGPATPPK